METDTLVPEEAVYAATSVTTPSTSEPSRKRPATPLVASCSPEPTKRARTDDDSVVEEPMASPRLVELSVQDDGMMSSRISEEGAAGTSSGVAGTSTDDDWRDARHIKLRQMSSDSTRDSGIAETVEDRPPLPLSARLPGNYYFLFVYTFMPSDIC